MGAEHEAKVNKGNAAERTSAPAADKARFPGAAMLALQRAAGNQVTNAMVQPKLEVGPVDDPYEREADEVAEAVLRNLSKDPAKKSPTSKPGAIARVPISKIARSATAASAAAGPEGGALEPSIESRILRASGGRSLEEATRTRFESAMGADLSAVRVHQNSKLAPEIGAHAFTHGTDVHFAPGTYDPSSSAGQRLLAHELTHVVQQTGGGERLQGKLWDEKLFKEKTAITARVGAGASSTAQDVILSLLKEYDKFIAKGFKGDDPTQVAQAVSKVKTMQDVANRWIANRGEIYKDPTNYTLLPNAKNPPQVEAPPPENPKQKRLDGLTEFVTLCDAEIKILSVAVSEDPDVLGAGIDTENKEYKKAVKRYPDVKDVSSVFAKVGQLAEMLVGAPGSKVELSIEAAIPVQPGVDVTFSLGGSAEKDTGKNPKITLRLDVSVGVKGSLAGAVELSASLGGYIEAKAKTGAEAATLMSYALYRRGREGSAPTELISLLWGGATGKTGMAKSEAWSRELEKQVWGGPVDPNDDPDDGPYVESGMTGKVGASVEGGVVEGELSGGVYAGRRIDKASLEERKGGAGAQNVQSASMLNAGKRQKRVSVDVGGWSFGAKVGAFGFSLEVEISRSARMVAGLPDWDDIEVEATGKGPMPPALDLGAKIWQLAEKIVRKSEEAEKKATAAGKNGEDAGDKAGAKELVKGLAVMGPQYFNPKMELPAAANLTVSIGFQGADWHVGIGTEKESTLPIPEILKVTLTKSQTFLEIKSKAGTITTWYLGAPDEE